MPGLLAALTFALLAAAPQAPTAAPTATPPPTPTPNPCTNADGTTGMLATLDRPTIGFSTCAVQPHEIVAEFGYGNEQSSDGRMRTVTYPQGFLRYGVRPGLELDAIGPVATAQRIGSTVTRGANDAGIGAKVQLAAVGPLQLAVDALLTLPTGAAAFTAGSPSETLNVDAAWSFTPTTSIGATVGYASSTATRLDGTSARYNALLPSIVVTQQFGAKAQAYLEAYGASRIRPDGGSRFALDGGLQYLVNERIEVDAELGSTVIDLARTHYLGVGIGLRM